jgi:hypothetical protein
MGSPRIFGLSQSSLHLAVFVVSLCPEFLEGRGPRCPLKLQEFPVLTGEVLG